MQEAYYSVTEVAEKFRVSNSTITRLVSNGELGSVKIGTQYRISETAIHDYLNRKEETQNA